MALDDDCGLTKGSTTSEESCEAVGQRTRKDSAKENSEPSTEERVLSGTYAQNDDQDEDKAAERGGNSSTAIAKEKDLRSRGKGKHKSLSVFDRLSKAETISTASKRNVCRQKDHTELVGGVQKLNITTSKGFLVDSSQALSRVLQKSALATGSTSNGAERIIRIRCQPQDVSTAYATPLLTPKGRSARVGGTASLSSRHRGSHSVFDRLSRTETASSSVKRSANKTTKTSGRIRVSAATVGSTRLKGEFQLESPQVSSIRSSLTQRTPRTMVRTSASQSVFNHVTNTGTASNVSKKKVKNILAEVSKREQGNVRVSVISKGSRLGKGNVTPSSVFKRLAKADTVSSAKKGKGHRQELGNKIRVSTAESASGATGHKPISPKNANASLPSMKPQHKSADADTSVKGPPQGHSSEFSS